MDKWAVNTSGDSQDFLAWGCETIDGVGASLAGTDGFSVILPGEYISPPTIDTHTHGCANFPVSSSIDQMAQLVEAYGELGTNSVQLSTVSSSDEDIHAMLKTARAVMDSHKALIGIHLEGPFLSPAKKGAHEEGLLRRGTREGIQSLLSDYLDVVSAITLDPLSIDEGVIAWLVEHNVTVAIGHTLATYDEAVRAFEEGAKVLTHAFNAMVPVSAREPGPVMAAIEQGAFLEVIADGHHVHPSLVTALFREAPGRVVLVTDSMPAAGHGDGHYLLGSLDVTVTEGVARTRDGALAGSTLLLPSAVHNAHRFGVPAEAAIAAATTVPMEAYGRTVPALVPGEPARLAVWSEDARLTHTIHDGVILAR